MSRARGSRLTLPGYFLTPLRGLLPLPPQVMPAHRVVNGEDQPLLRVAHADDGTEARVGAGRRRGGELDPEAGAGEVGPPAVLLLGGDGERDLVGVPLSFRRQRQRLDWDA